MKLVRNKEDWSVLTDLIFLIVSFFIDVDEE